MRKPIGVFALLVLTAGLASAATITVTKPSPGETWIKGQAYAITWTKDGIMPNLVRISLLGSRTLGELRLIQDNVRNTGSYSWTVPADISDGAYRIRVKVKDVAVADNSDLFKIAASSASTPIVIARPFSSADQTAALKFPALSISDVKLISYDDRFVVTFSYRNSGKAPLPKSSEMPVKPNFRVLIDNREVNRGSLIIPAFQAPPGWEMPTFYGCDIKYPTGYPWDFSWTIGNIVTVKINENKANGMASDSQSYNLKPMALNYSYDALITGATLDWNKGIMTISVRIDGQIGTSLKFLFVQNRKTKPYWYFEKIVDLVPGQHLYTTTQKIDRLANEQDCSGELQLGLLADKNGLSDQRDIEHRNNIYPFSFHR
jgi:hypothetical protein